MLRATMNLTRHADNDHRAAVLAGFLGWTLDAFDFFLVVMTLTAIAQEFHRSDAAIAFSITLTLAFRPLGAFLFGLLADRYGRRLPLMLDLVFYSIVEVLFGLAPTGVRSRLPARRGVLLRHLSALGVASPVLHRRAPGTAGAVRALPRARVGGVGAYPARELGPPRARHRLALEAVPLPHRPDGDDELRLARHPGPLSDVPAARLGLHADPARGVDRLLDGVRPDRRSAVRVLLGPHRPAPHHRRVAGVCPNLDPAAGVRTVGPAARLGCVRDAVHGPGRVGGDPGAHHRAGAGRCARLPARIRLSVRGADRRLDRDHRSRYRRPGELRVGHGAHRGRGVHAVRDRRRARPRAARGRLWHRGQAAR